MYVWENLQRTPLLDVKETDIESSLQSVITYETIVGCCMVWFRLPALNIFPYDTPSHPVHSDVCIESGSVATKDQHWYIQGVYVYVIHVTLCLRWIPHASSNV
jgi:hypothetical protein